MVEYIDRKAVLSAYKQTEIDAIIAKKSWPDTWEALGENLKSIPAVEVVRCKDCTYWERRLVNAKGFAICAASGMDITADDFCSYGERRDGE